MQRKADGTFLWVSLVISELRDVEACDVLEELEEFPTGLKHAYHHMMEKIKSLKKRTLERCRWIISTVITTYRPLQLKELHALSNMPSDFWDATQDTAKIVRQCGSFLTVRDDFVYVIHQSAKDYLSTQANGYIFPQGVNEVHKRIYQRSLEIMSDGKKMYRDMFKLRKPGASITKIQTPDPDPLAALRYSCIHWIDHVCDWSSSCSSSDQKDIQDNDLIHDFLKLNIFTGWSL